MRDSFIMDAKSSSDFASTVGPVIDNHVSKHGNTIGYLARHPEYINIISLKECFQGSSVRLGDSCPSLPASFPTSAV